MSLQIVTHGRTIDFIMLGRFTVTFKGIHHTAVIIAIDFFLRAMAEWPLSGLKHIIQLRQKLVYLQDVALK